jgi:hypothetical protein
MSTPDFPSIRLHNALLGALTDTSVLNVQVLGSRTRDGVPEYDLQVFVSANAYATERGLVATTTQGAANHLGARIRLTVRTADVEGTVYLLTPVTP